MAVFANTKAGSPIHILTTNYCVRYAHREQGTLDREQELMPTIANHAQMSKASYLRAIANPLISARVASSLKSLGRDDISGQLQL